MLRFNTFRAIRYLRSKFVEGKYLLASEATDLELELLDLLRQTVQSALGDNVAIEDAWKVERLSATEILIRPGEAWFDGLPYHFRYGKDHLVSGAVLSLGTVPVGVTAVDDSTGLGKIITFNDGDITPTNLYRVVITAREELITDVDDPFLKNVNLTESTAQKIRLIYQINIVPDALQTNSPLPYRDENSTSISSTNFPNSGGFAAPNFVNYIDVTPSPGGNGEQVALNLLSGSEGIDGRDLEIVLRNNPALGGGNPIPNSPTSQQAFSNGKLVDSRGTIYHINAIFNDTVSTQVVIRIDKEPDQPNPEIVNGQPFRLKRREVYVTDDVNGSPQGRKHWAIATVNWGQSSLLTHDSKVIDLRTVIAKSKEFQADTNQKIDIIPTGGGTFSFGTTTDVLDWNASIELVNAYGPLQTIPANSVAMMDGGALVYEMDLENGGIIARGNQSVTIASAGSVINLSGLPDLSEVRPGNVIRNSSGEVAEILAINDTSDQLTISPAFVNTGSATIYKDSFAALRAKLTLNSYVLAVRKNNKVWVGGGALELEIGEVNQLGDGVPQALLTYLGATDENDSDPFYSSTTNVVQGSPLPDAISELDGAVGDIQDALAEPLYDERLQFPSGLAALTNIVLPNNSRDGGSPQLYNAGSGELEVYHNNLFKFQGVDWNSTSNNSIEFTYDLPEDSEVHFRIDSISAGNVGGGGGGGGSLQDAYNTDPDIVTTAGNPVNITGPSGSKLLRVDGDMEVTGVIDPKAIEFTPMAGNPLSAGQKGIWVNLSNEVVFENGTSAKNISQSLDNIESGIGVNALTRLMFNGTGVTIPKGTPVYSPSAGSIAPANGSFTTQSRVIGITAENIAPSTNGKVAYAGMLTGISGFTHGVYAYLGDDPGEIVDVEPALGPYPAGFNVVILGIIENDNLMLQITHVGVL